MWRGSLFDFFKFVFGEQPWVRFGEGDVILECGKVVCFCLFGLGKEGELKKRRENGKIVCVGCGGKAAVKRPKSGEPICRVCFYKVLEDEVHETITKYGLFKRGEKVAIAASGGKGLLMVVCFCFCCVFLWFVICCKAVFGFVVCLSVFVFLVFGGSCF